MKKNLFFLSAILLPIFVYAQTGSISIQNPLGSSTFEGLITAIINWLLIITLPIIVILVLYAAFQFMVSGVSPDAKKNAVNIIKYAVIGYAIILLAKVLVGVITGFFA